MPTFDGIRLAGHPGDGPVHASQGVLDDINETLVAFHVDSPGSGELVHHELAAADERKVIDPGKHEEACRFDA